MPLNSDNRTPVITDKDVLICHFSPEKRDNLALLNWPRKRSFLFGVCMCGFFHCIGKQMQGHIPMQGPEIGVGLHQGHFTTTNYSINPMAFKIGQGKREFFNNTRFHEALTRMENIPAKVRKGAAF